MINVTKCSLKLPQSHVAPKLARQLEIQIFSLKSDHYRCKETLENRDNTIGKRVKVIGSGGGDVNS